MKYRISPTDLQLKASFKVKKEAFERELAAHNALHALGIFRSRTGDVDLNWPQPWYIRLGYAILGTLAWPFIK
ncbi:MAG: hypothetical protein IJP81_01565 [Bacteroidales bacterium]|nr:hypothetical protein [Bacteroidales bacterium]